MSLESEILRALKAKCYVSFVPNTPRPGNVRVCAYRKGKLGTERYVLSVQDTKSMADALREINDTIQKGGGQ